MKYEDFLTDDFGREVELTGFLVNGLNSMEHIGDLSNIIRHNNFPNQYKLILNTTTFKNIMSLMDEFKNSFNESVTVELKTGINSMTYYGVDYFIEHNKVNDMNIMIPANLNLVNAKNSFLIK